MDSIDYLIQENQNDDDDKNTPEVQLSTAEMYVNSDDNDKSINHSDMDTQNDSSHTPGGSQPEEYRNSESAISDIEEMICADQTTDQ